jgi:hypothetical protein
MLLSPVNSGAKANHTTREENGKMKKFLSTSLVAAMLVTGGTAALAKGNVDKHSHVQSVQETVALKKELIELRQELKQSAEMAADLQAKYEKLVAELEKLNDKSQALEVQLELLERTYKKGDHSPFVKVGKLLEATGSKDIHAFVDGKLVKSDVAPFIQNGRALVPVRAISAALKADVKWDPETRTVDITRGELTITLYLGKKEAKVKGKKVMLDTVPVLKKGRVFLPLRFVSEQLNANVTWQPEGKIVIIDDLQSAETTSETQSETQTGTNTTAETTNQK